MYSDDACAPGVANRGMKGYEWDASLLWDVRDGEPFVWATFVAPEMNSESI